MFLEPSSKVIATISRDYPEWHHGRKKFALWYLEIQDQELIQYLCELREQFSDVLFQPNTRQFHITLFICGFLNTDFPYLDDDFHSKQLQQQIKNIQSFKFKKIKLKTCKINSFSSALFLEIHDENHSLSMLRQLLSKNTDEIAALEYCPHITLGLYHSEFESDVILERMKKINNQQFMIEVSHITFGYYTADILQGLLYPLYKIRLGKR